MEQLVNFVIRPPRAEYDPAHDLLQPEFPLRGRRYQREDIEVINSHGHRLKCSHYMPIPTSEENPLPCVIYCHGNSGCRADASEAAVILLPSNITVFSLDFSGSGLSDGEFVTLGWNEKDDLKAVVTHLRSDKRVSCIGLWGRSMGAVTSLMYGAEDPLIAGIVLDSPFSNLVDLMMELVDVYKVRLPKFTLKVAIQYMRKVIQKKARFDILELDAIQVAKRSFIPALFGHATEDSFIPPHHSDLIYKAYTGDKNIIKFEGDHNSPRPRFYYDSINIFFHNVLQPPESPVAELASGTPYFDMDDLEGDEDIVWYQVLQAMQPAFVPPEMPGFRPDTADGTDGRSGWHMSRTEVPSNLNDLQADLSKLVETNYIDASVSEGSSSGALQKGSKSEDRSTHKPHGGMVNDDTWDSSLPHDLIDFSEPLRQSNSACFPSSAEGTTHGPHGDMVNDRAWERSPPHDPIEFPERVHQSNFADFPSSAEDEERMIKEAIAASLKGTDIHNSPATEEVSSVREADAHNPVSMAQHSFSTMSLPPDQAVAAGVGDVRSAPNTGLSERKEEKPTTSEPQTVGTLEALGQHWGLGLFRAVSGKQGNNTQS